MPENEFMKSNYSNNVNISKFLVFSMVIFERLSGEEQAPVSKNLRRKPDEFPIVIVQSNNKTSIRVNAECRPVSLTPI